MNRKLIIGIFGLGGLLVLGGIAYGVYYFVHQQQLKATTLSYTLTAEGQPLTPEEIPVITCNGDPISNGDRIPPGAVILDSESPVFRPINKEINIELGESNQIDIDLIYRTGSVRVDSSPQGANVLQAGKIVGQTPLKLNQERIGKKSYVLALEPWKDEVVTGNLVEGDELQLTQRFPHGDVSIDSSPQGVQVKAGSEIIGETPIELKQLPAGQKQYQLVLDGWDVVLLSGNLEDGKDLKLHHHFPRGDITINSSPTQASVVDSYGKKIGTTPLELKEVPVGDTHYLVQLEGHIEAQVSGTVKDGELLELNAELISFADIEQRRELERQKAEQLRLQQQREQEEKQRQALAEKEREKQRKLAEMRPGPSSQVYEIFTLEKMTDQPLGDWWAYGQFIACDRKGGVVEFRPVKADGFIRGYSTKILMHFPYGVPDDLKRQRFPMHPMDSNVAMTVSKSKPLKVLRLHKHDPPIGFAYGAIRREIELEYTWNYAPE